MQYQLCSGSKSRKFAAFLIVKSGFHIVVSVVSVVSVVRKKFIGELQLYGNLPYKCSVQKKRQIQLDVRDRMNSTCPMNFFRTTDTTDTTIWKPDLTIKNAANFLRYGLKPGFHIVVSVVSHRTDRIHSIKYNKLYLSFLLY